MARNGCKKVIIVNGHGGNENLLPYFAQSQLDKPHDYVVYVQWGREEPKGGPVKEDHVDMHAGETETSTMMIARPDLVHQDRAASESGADQKRVNLPDDVYTGIWWYARFPNHYSGDGALATKELGTFEMNAWIAAIDGSDSRRESRRPKPQAANRVLREEQASAGHAAVSAAFFSARTSEQSCYGKL